MSKLSLDEFPYEVLIMIGNYLSYKEIDKFSKTCARIHQVMDELWGGYAMEEKDGWHALSWAVRRTDNHLVKYLVGRKGIDINRQDNLGLTPLHWATRNPGASSIVTTKLLLGAGADLTVVDNSGMTPLQWAVKQNPPVVEHLLAREREIARPKSINIQDRVGQTALHRAVTKADEDLVRQLLKAGADMEITCNVGRTPLLWAASTKSLSIIKILVEEKESNVHHVTADGRNVLHLAATERTIESVSYFVAKGVDMGAQDNRGRTPLHWAAMYGNARTLRVLLNLGGDPTIKNEKGETASDYASTFPAIGDALRDFGVAVPKLPRRPESCFKQYNNNRSVANGCDGSGDDEEFLPRGSALLSCTRSKARMPIF